MGRIEPHFTAGRELYNEMVSCGIGWNIDWVESRRQSREHPGEAGTAGYVLTGYAAGEGFAGQGGPLNDGRGAGRCERCGTVHYWVRGYAAGDGVEGANALGHVSGAA